MWQLYLSLCTGYPPTSVLITKSSHWHTGACMVLHHKIKNDHQDPTRGAHMWQLYLSLCTGYPSTSVLLIQSSYWHTGAAP